jgi:hypothetical protein
VKGPIIEIYELKNNSWVKLNDGDEVNYGDIYPSSSSFNGDAIRDFKIVNKGTVDATFTMKLTSGTQQVGAFGNWVSIFINGDWGGNYKFPASRVVKAGGTDEVKFVITGVGYNTIYNDVTTKAQLDITATNGGKPVRINFKAVSK